MNDAASPQVPGRDQASAGTFSPGSPSRCFTTLPLVNDQSIRASLFVLGMAALPPAGHVSGEKYRVAVT
jgi:hypothetical protein